MTEKFGFRPPLEVAVGQQSPVGNWTRRDQLLHQLTIAVATEDDDDYAAAYDALIKFEKDAGEFDDHDYCTKCRGSRYVTKAYWAYPEGVLVSCPDCGGTGDRDNQVEIEARKVQHGPSRVGR
jgi:hypothetical protein